MSDYCTLWPEGWWSACCQAHDAAYGAGTDRMAADIDLLRCVASSVGDLALLEYLGGAGDGLLALLSVGVGTVMFVGVRLFGRGYWRKP